MSFGDDDVPIDSGLEPSSGPHVGDERSAGGGVEAGEVGVDDGRLRAGHGHEGGLWSDGAVGQRRPTGRFGERLRVICSRELRNETA